MVSGETFPGLVWATYWAWEPWYPHNTVCPHWSSELSWDPEKTACLSLAIFPSLLQSLIRQWFSSQLVSWNGQIWDPSTRALWRQKDGSGWQAFPHSHPWCDAAGTTESCLQSDLTFTFIEHFLVYRACLQMWFNLNLITILWGRTVNLSFSRGEIKCKNWSQWWDGTIRMPLVEAQSH